MDWFCLRVSVTARLLKARQPSIRQHLKKGYTGNHKAQTLLKNSPNRIKSLRLRPVFPLVR